MTNKTFQEGKLTGFSPSFVRKEAYSLTRHFAYPKTLISLNFAEIKFLLPVHVRRVNLGTVERSHFHNLIRKLDQDFRRFILQLQTQTGKSKFGGLLEIQLPDHLIAGVSRAELHQTFLFLGKPTFQSVRVWPEMFQDVKDEAIKTMKSL